jgi:hypothetical protein
MDPATAIATASRARRFLGALVRGTRAIKARYAPKGYLVTFQYLKGRDAVVAHQATQDLPGFIRETTQWIDTQSVAYSGFAILNVVPLAAADFDHIRETTMTDYRETRRRVQVD